QVPCYGLAAQARFAAGAPRESKPVRSRYLMVSERAGYKEFPVELDAATIERFGHALGDIVDGIASGVFPTHPGEESFFGRWANCGRCDFQRLCPEGRDGQWDSK